MALIALLAGSEGKPTTTGIPKLNLNASIDFNPYDFVPVN